MPKSSKQKNVGRPSVWKDSKKMEKYIKIWCSQFFEHLPVWEIAEEHNCSEVTIKRALKFVSDNFIKVPNEELINGAIYSIKERLKRITLLLELELKKDEPSNRNIVELNREIREDSRDLLKLQNLYEEKYHIELDASGSIKDILKALGDSKIPKKS